MKGTPIKADHDPGIREEPVWTLKVADVFVSGMGVRAGSTGKRGRRTLSLPLLVGGGEYAELYELVWRGERRHISFVEPKPELDT